MSLRCDIADRCHHSIVIIYSYEISYSLEVPTGDIIRLTNTKGVFIYGGAGFKVKSHLFWSN